MHGGLLRTALGFPAPTVLDYKNLSIAGFKLVEFLGNGEYNVAFRVEGTPEFYEKHGMVTASDDDRRLVLKLGYTTMYDSHFQRVELESLQRLSSNVSKAKEVGALLPLYSYVPGIPNPFDCKGDRAHHSERKIARIPEIPDRFWARICQADDTMQVIVVPYKKPELLFDRERTMEEYVTFLRSLLRQLDYAHSKMVSNNDLHAAKNIFVDEVTGGAVLFDWNYGMVYPHLMFPGNATVRHGTQCSQIPPEGLARRIEGYDTQFFSIHANDIWQVGKIFSSILYRPCVWACEILDEQDINKTLAEIILSLGGNTIIPVNATHEVDLAEILGLPLDIGNTTTFHPILQQGWGPVSECPVNSSWYLDDPHISEEKKSQAIDLLRKMLSISPYDRPPTSVLLEHPFLN